LFISRAAAALDSGNNIYYRVTNGHIDFRSTLLMHT
jgi:hypothetical protein